MVDDINILENKLSLLLDNSETQEFLNLNRNNFYKKYNWLNDGNAVKRAVDFIISVSNKARDGAGVKQP